MFKKLLSAVLSAATAVSFIPQIPARAEEEVRYPYVMFAGSAEEGAITINSNNVCINGSIATNGTISTTAQNFNVNGSRTENAQETMKFFFDKIESRYFTSHVDTYFEDYFLEDTNINVNIPIEAEGDIGLTGNINITSGIKALNDVVLSGNVENSQDSVICAETGDIIIDTDNVNLNGLVYAPNGCVNITAQNLNINSVIIIADTITITCPNLNANYNAQMAEFIGNGSEPINNDDIEIAAYGEYDEETEAFSVYWNTTVPDGSFDIQASDDGENYTSIGTVNDTDSFEFSFTEPFEKKYIKVIETANSGKVGESVPFVVISTEDGYDIEVLDSDEDGLPDIYELKIGTDPYDQDTDDDGLTDYQEYVYTQTDPLVYDSVTEGVSDADIDTDEDGLSNIDEFTRETYPWTTDTDQDGLSDYDEIYVYGTDPLVADSDEDGVDDGSEVKLGLDPNDPATNGVPDGEYVIPQTIDADSSILSSVNTAESPYELSIDIKTNGDAEKEFTVDESGYSAAIDNNAMLGASFDVEITDTCNPEEIVLKYDIKEGYTENTLNKFSSLEEFQGIKRLNVFRFDEDERMLLPVETEYDVKNNKLCAAVNETGTYCLMDMEIWLDNLDVEMPAENNVPAPKAAPKAASKAPSVPTSKWEPEYVNAPIDLVFFIQNEDITIQNEDSTNERELYFESEKNLIKQLSLYVFSKNSNVRVYIIPYDSTYASLLLTNKGTAFSSDYMTLNNTLNNLKYITPGQGGNRKEVSYYIRNTLSLRDDSDKFIFHLINSSTVGKLDEDIAAIEYAYSHQINYSQITPVENYFTYTDLMHQTITARDGLDLILADDNYETIRQHIEGHLSAPRPVYDIIVPTKWKKISLKGALIPNGTTNSDTDALTDWEEVDTSKLKINSDNSIELPVFCMADLVGHLTKFNQNGDYNFLVNDFSPRYYLPILSDPTDEDTDDDGLNDDVDPDRLVMNTPPFGTDEYFEEVRQKAAKSFSGTYNRTWYADLGGLLPLYINIQRKKDVIAKAELDIMMKDVNRYEKCLYTVSDENWLRFCEFFNECVMEYGTVDEELHYFRLKLNRTPSSFEELVNNKDNWYLYDKKHTRYHMNNSNNDINNVSIYISKNDYYPSYSTYWNEYNMKFVDKYGMNEVVVTPNKDLSGMSNDEIYDYLTDATHWQILTDDYKKAQNDQNFKYDPVNVGTYNYSAYDFDYINLDGTPKKTSSLSHDKYDVQPYLKDGENYGNVPGLIYGNSKKQRDKNEDYYYDNANTAVFSDYWNIGDKFR